MRLRILLCLMALRVLAQESDPGALLERATEEYKSGDYTAAIRDYRQVLRMRPNMYVAKVDLGAALSDIGKYDDAIVLFKDALLSSRDKKPVLMNLALAYFRKGELALARERMEEVHRLDPKDEKASLLLGDIDLRLGHPKETVDLISPLDRANQDNLDFQYLYGTALIGAGRMKEGVLRIQKVAEIANRADAYALAGSTLIELNEFKVAREDLERALRLNPKLPGIYTLVGVAQDKTGDSTAAEPNLREGLKTNADDFQANLTLGAILCKRRNLTDATPYLEHALKLRPKDPTARYQWGMLKVAMGDYGLAVETLSKLSRDNPDWIDPHVALSSLYYKLHRPEDGDRERQIVERLSDEERVKSSSK